jgi:hypothetical protein
MENHIYEQVLKQARRAYGRYRTKEVAARIAAGDSLAGKRDLSRETRAKLIERLVEDILHP